MITRDIILFGKPGSGKGTLGKNIIKADTGFLHMSTGDIFRDNMKRETELGLEIIEVMDTGELVNDELTCAIVEDWLEQIDENKYVIYDGFPRTEHQLHWLLVYYHENNRKLPFFVEIDISDEIVIERITQRAIEQDRPEDQKPYIIKQRLNVYDSQTNIIKELIHEYLPPEQIIKLDGTLPMKKVHNSMLQTIERNPIG